MKKFISKIKKVVVMAMGVIIAFPSKIFAAIEPENFVKEYQTLYGVRNLELSLSKGIWNIARITIIPIAVLIGLIVYFKKSKNSKKKKALVTILTIAIVAVIYCIVNKIL